MSCSFWNMRRRLRKQLNEKTKDEEKVTTDIATAQKEVKRARKPTAKRAVNKNDK